MYAGHTVGVVVPAYDEEGLVADVLAAIPDFVDRIYAVDDHSTDGTWAEILDYAADDERSAVGAAEAAAPTDAAGRVVPIRHGTNRGAGGAIKTGYLRAIEDGVDVSVTIDADGQMDPAEMRRIVDPVVDGVADYAKGNRLVRSTARGEMPAFRWLGNWTLTVLTKVASGYWRTRDPQNGYTAISRRALLAVDVSSLFDDFGYSNDLLARLNAAEMRVADVPMAPAYGVEESSIRLGSYVPTVSYVLARCFLWRLRARYLSGRLHPLAVCYLLGLVGVVAGLAYAVASATVGVTPGWVAIGALVTLPLLVVSGLFTAVGMAFDRWANRGLEVRLE